MGITLSASLSNSRFNHCARVLGAGVVGAYVALAAPASADVAHHCVGTMFPTPVVQVTGSTATPNIRAFAVDVCVVRSGNIHIGTEQTLTDDERARKVEVVKQLIAKGKLPAKVNVVDADSGQVYVEGRAAPQVHDKPVSAHKVVAHAAHKKHHVHVAKVAHSSKQAATSGRRFHAGVKAWTTAAVAPQDMQAFSGFIADLAVSHQMQINLNGRIAASVFAPHAREVFFGGLHSVTVPAAVAGVAQAEARHPSVTPVAFSISNAPTSVASTHDVSRIPLEMTGTKVIGRNAKIGRVFHTHTRDKLGNITGLRITDTYVRKGKSKRAVVFVEYKDNKPVVKGQVVPKLRRFIDNDETIQKIFAQDLKAAPAVAPATRTAAPETTPLAAWAPLTLSNKVSATMPREYFGFGRAPSGAQIIVTSPASVDHTDGLVANARKVETAPAPVVGPDGNGPKNPPAASLKKEVGPVDNFFGHAREAVDPLKQRVEKLATYVPVFVNYQLTKLVDGRTMAAEWLATQGQRVFASASAGASTVVSLFNAGPNMGALNLDHWGFAKGRVPFTLTSLMADAKNWMTLGDLSMKELSGLTAAAKPTTTVHNKAAVKIDAGKVISPAFAKAFGAFVPVDGLYNGPVLKQQPIKVSLSSRVSQGFKYAHAYLNDLASAAKPQCLSVGDKCLSAFKSLSGAGSHYHSWFSDQLAGAQAELQTLQTGVQEAARDAYKAGSDILDLFGAAGKLLVAGVVLTGLLARSKVGKLFSRASEYTSALNEMTANVNRRSDALRAGKAGAAPAEQQPETNDAEIIPFGPKAPASGVGAAEAKRAQC